jgi:hypothetical protein
MNSEQMITNGRMDDARVLQIILRFFIGGGIGFLIALIVLMIFSAAMVGGMLHPTYLLQYTIGVCFLAVFFAVKICNRFLSQMMVSGGLAVGSVFFLLLLLVGYAGFETMSAEHGGFGFCISALLGGALAGLPFPLSLTRRKKRSGSRRK